MERYWDGGRWTQVVRHAESIELKDGVSKRPATAVADPALTLPLAGWWRRFGSGVVDTVIAWALTLVLVVVGTPHFLSTWWGLYWQYALDFQTSLASGNTSLLAPPTALQNSTSSLFLVAGAVTAVYCIIFLGTWGATLGQKLCGVKVVRAPLPMSVLAGQKDYTFTEEKPGWFRAVSKGLSWTLLSTGGGFFIIGQVVNVLMPLWHRRKQSLTDLFANTLMVKTTRSNPPR